MALPHFQHPHHAMLESSSSYSPDSYSTVAGVFLVLLLLGLTMLIGCVPGWFYPGNDPLSGGATYVIHGYAGRSCLQQVSIDVSPTTIRANG